MRAPFETRSPRVRPPGEGPGGGGGLVPAWHRIKAVEEKEEEGEEGSSELARRARAPVAPRAGAGAGELEQCAGEHRGATDEEHDEHGDAPLACSQHGEQGLRE